MKENKSFEATSKYLGRLKGLDGLILDSCLSELKKSSETGRKCVLSSIINFSIGRDKLQY